MEPSDLETAVRQKSWEWLFDLPSRLNVIVEVVDDRLVPVFPVGPGPDAAAVRRLLSTADPFLRERISEALGSRKPLPVAVDGFDARCFRLAPAAALVVARSVTTDESPVERGQDLDRIGAWLSSAIEEALAEPPSAISVEPYRILSLRRVLTETMLRGSVRGVIGAFVEAVGVWDTARVRVYASGATGGFFQYVAPLGAHPSSAPVELDESVVSRDNRIVRLSRAEADQLGFGSEPGDVLLLRIITGTNVAWLLVFSGTIDDDEQVRLALYSDILRELLTEVLVRETGRVIGEMRRQELSSNQPLQAAAQPALEELMAAVRGTQSALAMDTFGSGRTLAIGDTDLLSNADQPRRDRLIATSSEPGSVLLIAIIRDRARFAAFERDLVESGAAALHAGLRGVLQRASTPERRRHFQPVEGVFDQLAAEAVRDGRPASFIVVSLDGSLLPPGVLLTWLGRIRGELRPGDFAAILSETEIGVLLCDTSAGQATAVSARLKDLGATDDGAGRFIRPVFGISTSSPDAPVNGSVVAAARAEAAALR
jgi:hypothetical protein